MNKPLRDPALRTPGAGAAALALAIRDDLTTLTQGAGTEGGLAEAMTRLGGIGALRAVLPEAAGGCGLGTAPVTALPLGDILRRLGRVDLALARLFEGHVNAARLVEAHGDADARAAMHGAVGRGAVMGVWGADGSEPLRHDGTRLSGGKRFASGLGLVTHAIVTALPERGAPPQMFLVEAGEVARHDPAAWTASAMRATRSGGFDATGLEGIPVGGPGSLMVEPHFEGGIWRYCAAHVGGAEGLIDAWRALLARMGREGDALQVARIGEALALLLAARRAVEGAALAVEGSQGRGADEAARAVAQALLAREATEDACTRILALCERALGMAAHDASGPIDRHRRDLSLFLRQAAPDAKRARAVASLSGPDAPSAGEAW